MMSLTSIQLASLLLTIFTVLGLGAFSARSVKSAEGYSLSGRSAGSILIAGGISGTAVGGSATVGTAQMAAVFGLSAWWFTLGTGLALVVLAVFYARPLRRSGLETIPQYLSNVYGRRAGPLMSVVSSLGILFSAVASALSGIHLISTMFAVPPWVAAAIIVALVIAYVMFGGMKGAGVSGILKMVILWMTLCAAGIAATTSLAQMPDFGTVFPSFPWLSLAGRGGDETVGNVLSLIVGVVCTQTYVQAVYSASDARVARTGTMIAALITIPVGLPSVAVGMFMHAHHPDVSPVLALPIYFVRYLPGWLGGIGLAGILVSVVGSIAGLALGIGTMIANDVGCGVFRIGADSRVLLLNRVSVLAVTSLSVMIALSALDSYVLDWNYMSMALRGAGVFLPLSLAIFSPAALAPSWALLSMVAGTVAAIACRLALPLSFNPLFAGLVVSIGVVGLGMLSGAETPRTAQQMVPSGRPARR